MKLITAVLRPYKLLDVMDVVEELKIERVTVTEITTADSVGAYIESYRGAEYLVDLARQVRVEMIVEEDRVQEVMHAVAAAARTGEVGDGRIWVTAIEHLMQIRTGDTAPGELE